jgi:putative acetyltransferase
MSERGRKDPTRRMAEMEPAVHQVEIRREAPGDYTRVFQVNAQAFETDAEARLVDALRFAADPVISLVAVVERTVVGHIFFTPVAVERVTNGGLAMGLGPMAVVPEYQRQGIGSALMRAGLQACEGLGAAAVFVVGHAEYYPRFGFEPATPYGLHFQTEAFEPYFMVRGLRPGALASISGFVHYLPEFEGV